MGLEMKQAGCPYCHDGYVVMSKQCTGIYYCQKCRKEVQIKIDGVDE